MSIRNLIIIVLLGAALFMPYLGHVHLFDWDEINFAESAREMLVSGNYAQVQINYQPFWEKPPLFIWLQAGSMQLFGVNEFAARFPNAIIGIITMLCLFYIGSRQINERYGWLWVICYIGSFLPQFYFKSGIIDPLFNLFIFLGIFQFHRLSSKEHYVEGRRRRISISAGIFIGLAILTKGPVALLIALLCLLVYWVIERFRNFMKLANFLIFLLVTALVSSVWFAYEFVKDPEVIKDFITYQIRLLRTQDAGHGGPFYYHWVVLLFGCFPASMFVFGAFRRDLSEAYEIRNLKAWMKILLLTVLILFSIVQTKIVHYSSLCYFPLTALAAYHLYRILYFPQKIRSNLRFVPLLLIGLAFAAIFISIPYFGTHTALLKPYIKDAFGKAALQADVRWNGWESITGIFYFIVIIGATIMLMRPRRRYFGVMLLFMGSAIAVQLVMYLYAPKIEKYSQAAAIEFFEEKAKEDAYTDVLGYKSYAQLFYGARPLPADPRYLNKDTLLTGVVNKPVYFVTKVHKAEEFINRYDLEKIGEKNGFVFLKRK